MRKVVIFHLFNDFSGSPKVLNSVILGLIGEGYEIDLITSNTTGFLSDLCHNKHVNYYTYRYRFSKYKLITAINYFYAQLFVFLFSLRYIKSDVVFWINTILPIGAAIMGNLMNKKIICHYHEDAHTKGYLYIIFLSIIKKVASHIICVSNYQKDRLNMTYNISTIPNSLDLEFETAMKEKEDFDNYRYKRVLMLSSLKKYKGIDEFVKLSNLLPQFQFLLVINDTIDNIKSYFKENNTNLPSNLTILDRQKSTLPYYQSSSLVLNLSDKNLFVETFGLTALEAMANGLPCIVPSVGGISELVDDGYNGYKIDVQNIDVIADVIKKILSDKDLYIKLSTNAINKFKEFSYKSMMKKIINVINDVLCD